MTMKNTMELIKRFENKIFYSPCGCWLWVGSSFKHGYGLITINYKHKLAHRVSYELFKGKIRKGLKILHSCDNPGCVNPDHLSQGTQLENIKQRGIRKRSARGESVGISVLNSLYVLIIRDAARFGFTYKEIADYYFYMNKQQYLIDQFPYSAKRRDSRVLWKKLKREDSLQLSLFIVGGFMIGLVAVLLIVVYWPEELDSSPIVGISIVGVCSTILFFRDKIFKLKR